MARGGFRPGAGRPKGARTATKQERKVVKTLEAAAADPEAAQDRPRTAFKTALDFAMDVINDPVQPMDAKVRLAIAAMPFQNPKLEAVGTGKKERQQEEAKDLARNGKFSTPTGPRLAVNNGG